MAMKIENAGELRLERKMDLWEYINKMTYAYCDDPRYKYYFIGGWHRTLKIDEDIGWSKERMAIIVPCRTPKSSQVEDKIVGFVSCSINRTHDDVDTIGVFIEPAYLTMGYGPIALLEFVKYLLIDRGFRKITYTTVAENTVQTKFMTRLIKKGLCRLVGVMKEEYRLMDGQYYDVVRYEVIRHEIIHINFPDVLKYILEVDLKL